MAEKIKKAIRDDGGVLTDERRKAVAAELGDVLWYVAQLATEAGSTSKSSPRRTRRSSRRGSGAASSTGAATG